MRGRRDPYEPVTPMACDVLILAAFRPELEGFEGRLRAGVPARTVGIGVPQSAAGAARCIEELGPRSVVLVGTCGAYLNAGLATGQVVAARAVTLVDHAALAGAAQFPEPMSVTLEADAKL